MKSAAELIPELSSWNNGNGIDVESWIGCSGSADLAVGYSTIFWPSFTLHDDYILRHGFSLDSLRGFERQCGADKGSIECVMNHLHIQDIHHVGDETFSADKAIYLGSLLKEIYELKLPRDFPDRPCTVNFYVPEDRDDLAAYEISFWQTKHNPQ
jgi:hypothetical protein